MTHLTRLPGAHLLKASPMGALVGSLSGEVAVIGPRGELTRVQLDRPALDVVVLTGGDRRDGWLLAVATPLSVEVIDPATGARVRSLHPGDGGPTRLVTWASGSGLAWGDDGGGLHRWRAGEPIVTQPHRKSIHQLQRLRLGDGERLLTGADDRYVYLIDPRTGEVAGTCFPHIDWLEGIVGVSTADGRGHLLAIDRRRMVTWRLDRGGAITGSDAVAVEDVNAWAGWRSTDGMAVFVVATADGRLLLGDGSSLVRLASPAVALAPSANRNRLAIAATDGGLAELDFATGVLNQLPRSSDPLVGLFGHGDSYIGLDTAGAVRLIRSEHRDE